MTVQGNTLNAASTILAVIDTGTTLVGGPASSIASIYSNIAGAQPAGAGYEGYWQYRTSAFPQHAYLWHTHDPFTPHSVRYARGDFDEVRGWSIVAY